MLIDKGITHFRIFFILLSSTRYLLTIGWTTPSFVPKRVSRTAFKQLQLREPDYQKQIFVTNDTLLNLKLTSAPPPPKKTINVGGFENVVSMSDLIGHDAMKMFYASLLQFPVKKIKQTWKAEVKCFKVICM